MTSERDPIHEFVAARIGEGRMAGAAWWVGPVGEAPRSGGALGQATNIPRPEPLRFETPFDLASLTKPLATAPLALLLEEEGALELTAPTGEYLPELAHTPLGERPLIALAQHAAGLAAWRPLYLQARSREAYVAAIAALPAATAPGGVLYSDLGYILLGIVLERATGRGLDQLFRERIAVPLGLARTAFATRDRFDDAAATEQGNAHERTMAGAAGERHPWRTHLLRGEVHDANAYMLGGAAGHAGLFGPIDEVARLAGEILSPTRLRLSPEARRRLLDAGPGGRTVGWVTAGHSAAARGILPDDAPGHTGFTGTSVWLDPARTTVSVLLTNRVHPRVPPASFHVVRRAFHRLALRALGR